MLSVGLSKFGSYRRPLAALALLLSLRTLLIELVLRELAGEPVNIITKITAHFDLNGKCLKISNTFFFLFQN